MLYEEHRTYDVNALLRRIELDAFGMIFVYHRHHTKEETRSYIWDKIMRLLWDRPVAPLFWLRGGLAEAVDLATERAWCHRD